MQTFPNIPLAKIVQQFVAAVGPNLAHNLDQCKNIYLQTHAHANAHTCP